jgi:hypothetical protein
MLIGGRAIEGLWKAEWKRSGSGRGRTEGTERERERRGVVLFP